MESPLNTLQERLQQLIDQYAADKIEIDGLKKRCAQLSEENIQLLRQVDEYSKLYSDANGKLQAMALEYETLKRRNEEIQTLLSGVESFADDAIKKIDDIIPKLSIPEQMDAID